VAGKLTAEQKRRKTSLRELEQLLVERERRTGALGLLDELNFGDGPPGASAPPVRKRRGRPRSPSPLAAGVALPLPPAPAETIMAVAGRNRPTRSGAGTGIATILEELQTERAQIEEAILSLERLALGRKRGPGRPRESVNLPDGSGNPPDGSPPPLPPAAAMLMPGSRCQLLWAVSPARKRA